MVIPPPGALVSLEITSIQSGSTSLPPDQYNEYATLSTEETLYTEQ